MKINFNKKKEKPFVPIDFNITLETIGEVRTFFHVFNRVDLKDFILEGEFYSMSSYSKDLDSISGFGEELSQEIKRQGFKV